MRENIFCCYRLIIIYIYFSDRFLVSDIKYFRLVNILELSPMIQ